jgi:phosphoglycerate dehydrogenase-like enzyme
MVDPKTCMTKSISTGELERRWSLVREQMAESRVDYLLMRGDEEYLGGYIRWISDFSAISGTEKMEGLASFKARKDILLTSARGIHGPQMSEMAIMLMIALTKQFPRILHNKKRRIWEKWPSPILAGKTAGILAVGTIGKAIARKCRAFEMKVLGVGPTPAKRRISMSSILLTSFTMSCLKSIILFLSPHQSLTTRISWMPGPFRK